MSENLEETTPENESSEMTIEDTKEQLATMYLKFLDQKKWGILGTTAWLGVNLNPLQKDAVEYLTTDTTVADKKDFLSNIWKNIKKKFVEKFTWWTALEYNKTSLNNMKDILWDKDKFNALMEAINKKKDDEIEIQNLMFQIEAGNFLKDVTDTTNPTAQSSTPKTSPENTPKEKLYLFPMEGNRVTSPKWPRWGKEHNGIDIWWSNKDIKSIGDGTVESVWTDGNEAEWFGWYGNYVVVKLPNGDRVLYGHLASPSSLKVGDSVKAGETAIWIMGETWHSHGVHLHLEIRKWTTNDTLAFNKREVVDPLSVIPVTKDMIEPDILARVDKTLLVEDETAPQVA